MSKAVIGDVVNSPSHYTQGKYEVIDVILDRVKNLPGKEAAIMSNIIRYTFRYEHKNGIEDLKKAQWYLNRLINELEKYDETTRSEVSI